MPDGTTLKTNLAADFKAKFATLTNAQATALANEAVDFMAVAWQTEIDQAQRQRDVITRIIADAEAERDYALNELAQLRAKVVSAVGRSTFAQAVTDLTA